ncbi:hypothetical protein [Haloimpatiens massiliensis]|uniref:hypothetical protein n=1 Tax=Haloimpatiens massiliensis TaxID=1658110 RepID=UPI000C83F6AE|nr:hypothetical protein [Haloimpatiens massiliensis]
MNKIKEIIDKYIYDKSIKKYSRKYFNKAEEDEIFTNLNSEKDIDDKIRILEYNIDYYKKNRPIYKDDIINMEKLLGEYEIAVHRVLQCYDIVKFKYNANEIQQLIDNIEIYEKEIQELNLIRMCQD